MLKYYTQTRKALMGLARKYGVNSLLTKGSSNTKTN